MSKNRTEKTAKEWSFLNPLKRALNQKSQEPQPEEEVAAKKPSLNSFDNMIEEEPDVNELFKPK